MGKAHDEREPLSRGRMIFATFVVVATVLLVWKVIDFRTQPPPPPNPVGMASAP